MATEPPELRRRTVVMLPTNEEDERLVASLLRERRVVTKKCPGCRCSAPKTNQKCGCCGRWPDTLPCVRCGKWGRFDTDLLLTTGGTVHDQCHRRAA